MLELVQDQNRNSAAGLLSDGQEQIDECTGIHLRSVTGDELRHDLVQNVPLHRVAEIRHRPSGGAESRNQPTDEKRSLARAGCSEQSEHGHLGFKRPAHLGDVAIPPGKKI
ncbi:MAG: hypothetical protein MI919_16565 [Holophagales bacterium]|nr:hypothetical protein [Holophagales bacterium]